VADLARNPQRASEQSPIQDQTTTDTVVQFDVHDISRPIAGAPHNLGKCFKPGTVVHDNRKLEPPPDIARRVGTSHVGCGHRSQESTGEFNRSRDTQPSSDDP